MKEHTILQFFDFQFTSFIKRTYCDDSNLHRAVSYILEGKGKRVRAFAAYLACSQYSKDSRAWLASAVALEMIHAYSLVHDDLPCMDNDDLRRGRPTAHIVFGEAVALLAGDALLTDAFRVLTDDEIFPDSGLVDSSSRLQQISILSQAAGGLGMVQGQQMDLFWTGTKSIDFKVLETIHRKKTGALFGASFAMGAIAGGASASDAKNWRAFGEDLGLAFQAIDDTLDASGNLGKTPGKDQEQGKLTFLTFLPESQIQRFAMELIQKALNSLPVSPSLELTRYVDFLIKRTI